MPKKPKVSRRQIARRVSKRTGYPAIRVDEIVCAAFDEIIAACLEGFPVNIQLFGTFQQQIKHVVSPVAPPRTVRTIRFRPSHALKHSLRETS